MRALERVPESVSDMTARVPGVTATEADIGERPVRDNNVDRIEFLFSRGTIDRRQYDAGSRYQVAYSVCSGVGSALPQERVDGGWIVGQLADHRARAITDLNAAHREMGRLGSSVIYLVAIEGHQLKDAATRLGISAAGARDVLVWSLGALATMWRL